MTPKRYENDYKIVVKNGKVEDKGSYYYITPNNPGLFGYWKEDHTVGEYSCDKSITISKAGIDRNLTLTAKDTACGWFFGLSTETQIAFYDDEYILLGKRKVEKEVIRTPISESV